MLQMVALCKDLRQLWPCLFSHWLGPLASSTAVDRGLLPLPCNGLCVTCRPVPPAVGDPRAGGARLRQTASALGRQLSQRQQNCWVPAQPRNFDN